MKTITKNKIIKKAITLLAAVVCFNTNAQVSFSPAVGLGQIGAPQSVINADFNRDGLADVAVLTNNNKGVSPLYTFAESDGSNYLDIVQASSFTSLGDNYIVISLGNGAGGFSAPINFPAGTNPTSITSGDFNGDGKVDLAVTNATCYGTTNGTTFTSDNVSIFLGTGTGNFGSATSFAVGSVSGYGGLAYPASITSADFNGDGKADLATANMNSNEISILIGTGTGSFNPAINWPLALVKLGYGFTQNQLPISIISADFNRDGKADLATANINTNNVSVFLGDGHGSLFPPTDFLVGGAPSSLVSADFNGDGKADFATANYDVNTVSV
ncbi:MAG TPA: VCBS repeat-containing protein, partial [Bacteroidia bacterium]|nr:VCBS repeat-containing protein [Bacteroidia bacterium]